MPNAHRLKCYCGTVFSEQGYTSLYLRGLARRGNQLANPSRECFNQNIETGVLHEVGLRNTLEPDPDNTGVGSFRSRTALLPRIPAEFSCFMELETRGFLCSELPAPIWPILDFNRIRTGFQARFRARWLLAAWSAHATSRGQQE